MNETLDHHQPVCSSEGSPCSRSDTQSPGLKSYSVDDQNYDMEEHVNNSISQNKESEDGDICGQSNELVNKRESQVPIFHQRDIDDEEEESIRSTEHLSQQPQLEILSNNETLESTAAWSSQQNTLEVAAAQEESSFFSNTFESTAQASTNWTTFDDGSEEIESTFLNQTRKPVTVATSHNVFQDNFGDPIDWSTVDEGNVSAEENYQQQHTQEDIHGYHQETEEKVQQSKVLPGRQLSSESQHSVGKCKRFSHRHVDADHICRGHSLETSEDNTQNNTDTYTDWWPPSAEGAPISSVSQSVPANTHQRKRQISGTGNEAYTATPDHKPVINSSNQDLHLNKSSSGWSDDAFAEPLEARFKIFSKVFNAANNPNGMDPRSMTPHNDPISDNDSGIIPKSDSVNIFSIKDDPFDDDFFT